MNTVGVYGAAFDPPHRGHADVVCQALAAFDAVWLVPAANHAFGKRLTPFEDRAALVRAFRRQWFADSPRVRPCTLEAELAAVRTPVYSLDLLNALAERHPDKRFVLIVGPDNADPATWSRFHGHREIEDRFGVWAARERFPVRSTRLRELMACHTPGNRAEVIRWLGPAVAARAGDRGLYRRPAQSGPSA